MLPLSVLDLAPVTTGGSGPIALRNSLDLGKHVDALGYARYWVAEHHNLPSIASSAPEIMIGQIAAVTSHIRVGSGGVMLPNHAPISVAERFKTLEALFPGRIDLGLGRAPGTDQITSLALRRRQDIREDDDFLERFQELLLLEQQGFPDTHPFSKVRAMPQDVPLPPLYLLGSSGYSAQLSAQIGVGFAFAHHFASYDPVDALMSYRNQFRPGALAKPHAILAVAAVCADTDAEADRIATTIDLNFVRRSQGDYLPLASPEEAAAYPYTPRDFERIRHNRQRMFVGAPETVRAKLMQLVDATKADEVMITTMVYDHAARKHSYTLLARAFGLSAPAAHQVETSQA
jgi:luciferase family oxidoreductase group 1